MRKYKVNLTRSYVVTIKAENKEKARRYAEFYIGDCYDLSTFEDSQKEMLEVLKKEAKSNSFRIMINEYLVN